MLGKIGTVVVAVCTSVFVLLHLLVGTQDSQLFNGSLAKSTSSESDNARFEQLASKVALLQKENQHLKTLYADVVVTIKASHHASEENAKHMNEFSAKVTLLQTENTQLKTQHVKDLNDKALLDKANKSLKTQYAENVKQVNELSAKVTLLQAENTRLTTQHNQDVKVKNQIETSSSSNTVSREMQLDCWDSIFNDRHFVDYKQTNETAKQFLPFFAGRNSRSCRTSRTNYGDETKFLPVLRKLAGGECITAVFIGGSITRGDRVGGGGVFSSKLIETLNIHMPCTTKTGSASEHKEVNLGASGTTSEYHVNAMQTMAYNFQDFDQADLVVVEFAANDSNDNMGPIEGISESNKVQYWTEALIRLLKMNAPQAGIIYLEASAQPYTWAVGGWHPGVDQDQHVPPYISMGEHLDVLKYYDIMQIDMMRLIGPIGTKEKNNYLEKVYFVDAVHPGYQANSLIASVLSFTLRDMVANINNIENDFRVSEPTLDIKRKHMLLPTDWVPMQATLAIDFKNTTNVSTYTNVTEDAQVNNGWAYGTDRPGKWSSNTLMSSAQGSCVKISNLHVAKPITEFRLVVMKSYENFGMLDVTMFCNDKKIINETFDCNWASRTTQLQSVARKLNQPLVGCVNVIFEVCHKISNVQGEMNKVKLLQLSLWNV